MNHQRLTSKTHFHAIQTANKVFKGNLFFDGSQVQWLLQDNLLLSGTKNITLNGGNFISNDHAIQAKNFIIAGAKSISVDFGKSIVCLRNAVNTSGASALKLKKKNATFLPSAQSKLSSIQIIDSVRITIIPPRCNGDSNGVLILTAVLGSSPGPFSFFVTDGNNVVHNAVNDRSTGG